MLGQMEVVSLSGERAKFRSRSVQTLLAFLALHPGKEVSRFLIEETIWPESDSVKQAQNFRRAIADLRDAFEAKGNRGDLIETRREVVCAHPTFIASDVSRFSAISERGLREADEDLLAEAVALYRGPLLENSTDEWVYGYRLDFEERFGQCVDALCRARVASGAAKEAVRIGRSAVLLAPTREDIQVALIRAYRCAGLETEALRQFEDLERMMDETWGEPPSAHAREALEGKLPDTPTAPQTVANHRHVPVDFDPSGGALKIDSAYYVRRSADDRAEAGIDRGEGVILLQGPRQVGKSSLLARALAHARSKNISTVLCDFQSFGESQLGDEERLYKTLAHSASSQLKSELNLEQSWSSWLGPNMNLDAVLGHLLAHNGGRVIWGIDEADRLFGRPYSNDFFGLLRSWHNRRALDPGGPWSKLTLVLSYAAEAHLFISDLNQSPFNVGIRLPLRDFSIEEVTDLASRYNIRSEREIEVVYRTTNGHPFLSRRAFAFLSQGRTCDDLEASCALPDGPFGDHLQIMLGTIHRDPELLSEIERILSGKAIQGPTSRARLIAAGILSNDSHAMAFRVPAYSTYFRAAST